MAIDSLFENKVEHLTLHLNQYLRVKKLVIHFFPSLMMIMKDKR